jgi:DNA-binding transcriptional LysR family regulator
LELQDIRAFVTVAEELHFGRAARRLYIAQPPLSSRIRLLEAELKVQLFDRSTRSVKLTDAGARLLKPARQTLMQAEGIRSIADSIADGYEGTVRLGFAGASGQRILPLLTGAIRKSHPGIRLVLESQAYGYAAMDQVLDGTLDLALARTPIPHMELASRVVEVEELLCALPVGHPLAERETLSVGDLVNEDFISFPDSIGSMLRSTLFAMCAVAGFVPKVVQEAPDSATVLAFVAAGAGITITLSSVQHVQVTGITYRRLTGVGPSHMFAAFVWRRDNDSPALTRVLEVSRRALPTVDSSGLRSVIDNQATMYGSGQKVPLTGFAPDRTCNMPAGCGSGKFSTGLSPRSARPATAAG